MYDRRVKLAVQEKLNLHSHRRTECVTVSSGNSSRKREIFAVSRLMLQSDYGLSQSDICNELELICSQLECQRCRDPPG